MMDDGNLRSEIYANMQLKTTAELLKIWEENDHDEWTPLALDVVKKILFQRTGRLPEIPAYLAGEEKPHRDQIILKLPKNKLIRVTSLAYIIIFLMLIILNPTGENGYKNIIGDLCIAAFGLCFLILCIYSSHHAWIMDAVSFRQWRDKNQMIITSNWIRRMNIASPSDGWILWSFRLLGIFGALIVLCLCFMA